MYLEFKVKKVNKVDKNPHRTVLREISEETNNEREIALPQNSRRRAGNQNHQSETS